jgi:hypothetical protein
MITIYSTGKTTYQPYSIPTQDIEECGELQFCIDLIHWPRFDISWSYRAIFSFVIFMGIMLHG